VPSPLLRKENKIKILRYILKNGKTTRNQLASNLNLAHSTLSYIIDELLDEGFLVFEEIKKERGRPYQILSQSRKIHRDRGEGGSRRGTGCTL